MSKTRKLNCGEYTREDLLEMAEEMQEEAKPTFITNCGRIFTINEVCSTVELYTRLEVNDILDHVGSFTIEDCKGVSEWFMQLAETMENK